MTGITVIIGRAHLIVLTCEPHTVCSRAVLICHRRDVIRPEVTSPDQK